MAYTGILKDTCLTVIKGNNYPQKKKERNLNLRFSAKPQIIYFCDLFSFLSCFFMHLYMIFMKVPHRPKSK